MDDRHRQFAQYATALNQLTGPNSGGNDRGVRERSVTDGRSSTGSTSSGSSNSSGGGAAAAAAAVAAAAVSGNPAIWGELSRALQYNYPGFSSGTGWPPPPHQGGSDFHRFGGYSYSEGSNEGRNTMESNRSEGRRVPSKGETKVTPPLPPGMGPGMGSTLASLQQLVTNDDVYRTLLAQQYAAAAAFSALPPTSRPSLSPIPPSNRSSMSPNQMHNAPPLLPRHHQHLEHMSNQQYHQVQQRASRPLSQSSPPAQLISPNFPPNPSALSPDGANINGEYLDPQVGRLPQIPQMSPHNPQKERMMEQHPVEQLHVHHPSHSSPKSSSISPIDRYPPHDGEKEMSCIYESDKHPNSNMRSYDGGFRSGSESEGDQRARHRRKQDQPRRQSVIYSHTPPSQSLPPIAHPISADSSSDDSQGYDVLLNRPVVNHNEISQDSLHSGSPAVDREVSEGTAGSMSQAMSHALAHPFLAAHLNPPDKVSVEKKVDKPPPPPPAPPTMHIGDVPAKRIYVKDHRELCEPTDSPPSTTPPSHSYFDNSSCSSNFMTLQRQINCIETTDNQFNDPSASIRTSQPNCLNLECSGPVKKRKLSQNCLDYVDPRNPGCMNENQSELPTLQDAVVSCDSFISSDVEKFPETVLNGNIFENRDITITEVRPEVTQPEVEPIREERKEIQEMPEKQPQVKQSSDLFNGDHDASYEAHTDAGKLVHPKPLEELESPTNDSEHRRRTRQKRPVSYVEDETDPVLETNEDFTPVLSPVKKKGRKPKEKCDSEQGNFIDGSNLHTNEYPLSDFRENPSFTTEKLAPSLNNKDFSLLDNMKDKMFKSNKYIPSSIKEPLHVDTSAVSNPGPPPITPVLHSPDIYDFNDDSENTSKGKKGKRGRKRGSPRRPTVSSPEFFRSHLSPRGRDQRSSSKSPRSPKFFNSRTSDSAKQDGEPFNVDTTKDSTLLSPATNQEQGTVAPHDVVDENTRIDDDPLRVVTDDVNCRDRFAGSKNSILIEEVEANLAAFHRLTEPSNGGMNNSVMPQNSTSQQCLSTSNEEVQAFKATEHKDAGKHCNSILHDSKDIYDKNVIPDNNREALVETSTETIEDLVNDLKMHDKNSLIATAFCPSMDSDKLESQIDYQGNESASDTTGDLSSTEMSPLSNRKLGRGCKGNIRGRIGRPRGSTKKSVHEGYKSILEKSFNEDHFTHSNSDIDIKSLDNVADNILPTQPSIHIVSVPETSQNDGKQNSGRGRKRPRGRPRADSDRSLGSCFSDNDPLPSNSSESGIPDEHSIPLDDSSPRLRRSRRSANSHKVESSPSAPEHDDKRQEGSKLQEDPKQTSENSTQELPKSTCSFAALPTSTFTSTPQVAAIPSINADDSFPASLASNLCPNSNIVASTPDPVSSATTSNPSLNDLTASLSLSLPEVTISLQTSNALPSNLPHPTPTTPPPAASIPPTSQPPVTSLLAPITAVPSPVSLASSQLMSLPQQQTNIQDSMRGLQQLDSLICNDETEAETVENIAKFLEATAPSTSELKSPLKATTSADESFTTTPNSSFASHSTTRTTTPSTGELSYREARPKRVSRPPPEMNDGEMNDLLLLLNMEDEESEDEDYIPKDTEEGLDSTLDSEGLISLDEDENEVDDSDVSPGRRKPATKKGLDGFEKELASFEGICKKKKDKRIEPKKKKFAKSKAFDRRSHDDDRKREDSRRKIEEKSDKRAPFIRLGGMKELETIINVPDKDEEDKERNSRKLSIPFYLDIESSCKTAKVGFNSTLHNNYDAFNKDLSWFCAFCKNYSHYRTLGDLFGPFFVKGLNKVKKHYPEVVEGQVVEVSMSPVAVCSSDNLASCQALKPRSKRTPKHDSSSYDHLDGRKTEIGGVSPPSRFVPSATPARMVGRPTASVPSTPDGTGRLASPRILPVSPIRQDAGGTANQPVGPPPSSGACSKVTSTVPERHSGINNEVTESSPPAGSECWLHESCILWASGISVVNSKLNGLEEAVLAAQESVCSHCGETGATVCCLGRGCCLVVHVPCARWLLWNLDEKNFQSHCPKHILKAGSCPKEKVQQSKS